MANENDSKLYIPLGVKTEREIFSGFGHKQLYQAIFGTVIMAFTALCVYLLSKNIAFGIVVLMFGAVGSVMMCTKDQSNLSIIDHIQNMMRFYKGQKIYSYKYCPKWSDEK